MKRDKKSCNIVIKAASRSFSCNYKCSVSTTLFYIKEILCWYNTIGNQQWEDHLNLIKERKLVMVVHASDTSTLETQKDPANCRQPHLPGR